MQKKYSLLTTAEKTAEIMQWIDENKGKDPAVLDLTGHNAFTESLIIVSATSVRHAQSLAEGVAELCRNRNFEFLRMEGKSSGQWVLLDLNDIVVNIFQEPVRDLYKLESLWDAIQPETPPTN